MAGTLSLLPCATLNTVRAPAMSFFLGGVQAVKHKVVSTASFNQQRFQVPEMEKQITFGIQANPFFNATTN